MRHESRHRFHSFKDFPEAGDMTVNEFRRDRRRAFWTRIRGFSSKRHRKPSQTKNRASQRQNEIGDFSMIKQDLARKIGLKFNLSLADSKRILDFSFSEIRKELKRNKRVEFRGFGTWHVTKVNARIYQDKKGRVISIPRYRKAIFRQAKHFFK